MAQRHQSGGAQDQFGSSEARCKYSKAVVEGLCRGFIGYRLLSGTVEQVLC